ncbi:MAG: DNA gyrase subunit A [Armatimonadota bacterium]|nr:DNA gyrase subunit A [Armatimonadota bacterium]MDR5702011.1 DNA gyrase subunit A [Armatimonadota bacterium]MDR7434691.1 DNA gyrase subunit A [Armatimonadota bacterium]
MAMEESKVIPRPIEEEMKASYLDYAMSVIVSRALPDVRDGLKPVQRRILYGMLELGLRPDAAYKKCARIVGDVMGRYHPHGDAPVYEALVRMAQEFSFRYPLVDGQGNFGSVDGDSPAAMRYTEARLSSIAMEMLADIDKETVDFMPNFDQTMMEPTVLPARVPNLLMNGASGIAVGMATNIPPHNLSELVDALVYLVDRWDPEKGYAADPEDLLKIVKGPDFPTGGLILGKEGIRDAYLKGKGSIPIRAKATIEELRGGRTAIVVTEIPYMVNKAALIERIAGLVREKKVTGITDLRDESDREGLRIVIELRRDANPQIVLNQLYKHTQMQTSFGAIMLALVDGIPRILTLKELLTHYLEHRRVVTERRIRHELSKAEQRLHIVEGLHIALQHLDEVLALIRKSKDVPSARKGLASKFGLSEVQADAILEMRLQRLTALEREKLEEEHRELLKRIASLREILLDPRKILGIVRQELLEIKERYGDERRTRILAKEAELEAEDLIADTPVVVTLTRFGYIKRQPLDVYRSQRRGGRGIMGMETREEDVVEHAVVTTNHSFLLFFTDRGKVYRLKAYEVPEAGRTARGVALSNLVGISGGERVNAVIGLRSFEEAGHLFMVTKYGFAKKTGLMEFIHARRAGVIAVALDEGDELVGVRHTDGTKELVLATRLGQAIRFHEKDIREMGRAARGVRAIRLRQGDEVVGVAEVHEGRTLLTVTDLGYGKRTPVEAYPLQRRGGKGVRNIRIGRKNGHVVTIRAIDDEDEILIVTTKGIVFRCPGKDLSIMGRNAQGVRIIKVGEDDRVAAVAKVSGKEE